MIQLITITAPTTEPITTAEAKDHLRVTFSDDDTYIDALIATARQIVEARSGMRLFSQTVELRADFWSEIGLSDPRRSDLVSLRVAPVQSVSSVKYYDDDDVDTTMTSSLYWTDLSSVPCRIQVKNEWPSINDRAGNIRITMIAGWATTGAIPEIFKSAIKLLVGHYYENREEVTDLKLMSIPEGIDRLIFNNPEFHHYSTGSM
jgi:uncharacterized phiE125 gp8 family phage protein